jgi:hypothetical protein
MAPKYISILLAAVLFASALSGCGGDGSGDGDDSPNFDDLAYLAEYPDIDISPSFPRSIVARGDFLYFIVGKWLDDGERTEYSIAKVFIVATMIAATSLSMMARTTS